ncbi:MAG: UDP-glucose 4-epimerase GalE [Bacteroidetes bacterium]|nr:UDP-glucose 4-epimerase GalE [Bacteroidota bacterium]
MRGSKVIVTGGAGYIGAHAAVSLIQNGFSPIIVDNLSRSSNQLLKGIFEITGHRPEFYELDCRDFDRLKSLLNKLREVYAVIHFAAYKSVSESVAAPELYYDNNLNSLLSVLKVMKESDIKYLIFSSSCTVYGEPDRIPVTEDSPFKRAESPYGATKQMSERILEDAVISRSGLKVVSLRYFNPIGAHPSGLIGELPIGVPSNLVPYITQTAAGKRDKLIIFGDDYDTPDGSCLRDFIHVVDLADAHVKALQNISNISPAFLGINVGTGVPVSVLQLVHEFVSVTGVDLPYEIGPRREGDVIKTYADPTRAKQLLHWEAKRSIREALNDAWNWEKRLSHATN